MKANRPRPLWPYFLLTAIGLILATMANVAHAQGLPPCLAYPAVVETLDKQYGEAPMAVGLVNAGAAVVLFTAPDGASWTLVVRKADGETCIMATGSNWLTDQAAPAGEEG